MDDYEGAAPLLPGFTAQEIGHVIGHTLGAAFGEWMARDPAAFMHWCDDSGIPVGPSLRNLLSMSAWGRSIRRPRARRDDLH